MHAFPAVPADLPDRSVALARRWAEEAASRPTSSSARLLARMLKDPSGLAFTSDFIDRVVRPRDAGVAAHNLRRVVLTHSTAFLPPAMRVAAGLGAVAAPLAPALVVPVVRRTVRQLVGHLVADARPNQLGRTIETISRGGDRRLNLNLLGEAVLGDAEAERHFNGTIELLTRDDVDYVSIKVSSVVSQLSMWAWQDTVEQVVDRIAPLYELAAASPVPKFINLDMEEYRDLELTVTVFTTLLDQPRFRHLRAGIVLQAYLPDTLGVLQRLVQWAQQRVAAGGAPIKIRVVKGANLAMERLESVVHRWPLATWSSKQQTDTNYKRILNWGFQPEITDAVSFGVAGHNLFDVAFAHLLAADRGVSDRVEHEMLLGMAEGQQDVIARDVGGLLLYTPVVRPDGFDVAISYLIRRLEENASPENFMSSVFDLDTDPRAFGREEDRFRASLADLDGDVPGPNRTQNRAVDKPAEPQQCFASVPDTDPALSTNRDWIGSIIARSETSDLGVELVEQHRISSVAQVETMIRTAAAATDWAGRGAAARAVILRRAAVEFESRRADFLEVAANEAGKVLAESDPEVSEAVDFLNYYAERAPDLDAVPGAVFEPARITVVTPPWNFPVAIPTGSTAAALATGSAVIVKPAPQAIRCGALMVETLWRAGVPREVLQLANAPENQVGQRLIAHPSVDQIVLTGAYETAKLFASWRPGLKVLAETSGKNSIIVTPSCDVDQAVAHIVQSAFGHAGQKCSAGSLAILVGSMAEDERFLRQLVDATRSLVVDYPWQPTAKMGPLIEPADGKLLRGLTELGPGERWLLEPHRLDDSGKLWSPGIRAGVRPGSDCHLTEFFGPILGLIPARSLDQAIEIQNGTDYGLTAGLESLDAEDLATWLDRVQAGNLYVNRGITGAIVRRQPFGGWKHSSIGPGAKAGGPNYLLRLGRWRREDALRQAQEGPAQGAGLDAATARLIDDAGFRRTERAWLEDAALSDLAAWQRIFSVVADPDQLGLERNLFRYLPVPVMIRSGTDADAVDLARTVLAGHRAGSRMRVSAAGQPGPEIARLLDRAGAELIIQSEDVWLSTAPQLTEPRIRLIGSEGADLAAALGDRPDIAVYDDEVTAAGRIELLPFLHEQAISITANRFGVSDSWSESVI